MKPSDLNQGSVLIASLWAISIFSVFMSQLTFEGFQHTYLMKREIMNVREKIEFQSALGLFMQKLFSDARPHEDDRGEEWYGALDLPEPWQGKMEVLVQDEESKINLNLASEKLILSFLKLFDEKIDSLKMNPKDFIKQILKQRQKFEFQSYEELYLLEDVEAEDLDKLHPYFTIYTPSIQLNLNTTDPLILEAAIESIGGDAFASGELLRKIEDYQSKIKSGEMASIASADLTPDGFTRYLNLRRSLTMLTLLNQLVPFLTLDSKTYHLSVKLADAGDARAVVKDGLRGFGIDILSWSEA